MYIAQRYKNERESTAPYQAVQSLIRPSAQNLSAYRIYYGDAMYVVVLGDRIEPRTQKEIQHIFEKDGVYTPCVIPSDLEYRLAQRRKTGILKATKNEKGHFFMEDHDAFFIDSEGEGEKLKGTTKEKVLKTMRKPERREPFIQYYCDIREYNLGRKYLEVNYEAVDGGLITVKTLYDALFSIHKTNRLVFRTAEKLLFTPSGMRMHEHFFTEHKHFPIGSPTWIMFEEPFDSPYGEDIKAIYFYPGYPEHEIEKICQVEKDPTVRSILRNSFLIEKDIFIFHVVKNDGEYAHSFRYNAVKKVWEFLPQYECPTRTCTYKGGNCIPCKMCLETVDYWISWFLTARKMASGEYSPLPEKINFQKREERYTIRGKTAVGKGKNKRFIEADILQRVEYEIITYDISRERKTTALRQTIEQEGEKRTNWLKTYDPEDIEYHLKDIAPFERYYTVKNFKRLHERILIEGEIQRDGRYKLDDNLYRLSYTPDGEMLVVGSVVFENGKYVPFLRKDIIKRIIASEEENE